MPINTRKKLEKATKKKNKIRNSSRKSYLQIPRNSNQQIRKLER